MNRQDIAEARGPRGHATSIWHIDADLEGIRLTSNGLRRMTWAEALDLARRIQEMHVTSPLLKLFPEGSE